MESNTLVTKRDGEQHIGPIAVWRATHQGAFLKAKYCKGLTASAADPAITINNRSKIYQKSTKNYQNRVLGQLLGPELRPCGRFWKFGEVLLGQNPLEVDFSSIFELNLGPCWGHVEAVSINF